MTNRITKAHLENLVARINDRAGMEAEPYRKDPETGRYKPNAGVYLLDWAYGGVKLARMSLDEGCTGQSNPIQMGYETKRIASDMIYAFLMGMENAA